MKKQKKGIPNVAAFTPNIDLDFTFCSSTLVNPFLYLINPCNFLVFLYQYIQKFIFVDLNLITKLCYEDIVTHIILLPYSCTYNHYQIPMDKCRTYCQWVHILVYIYKLERQHHKCTELRMQNKFPMGAKIEQNSLQNLF